MASQNRIVGLATSNARLSLTVTTNMFRVTKVPNRNVQKYEGKSSLYRVNLPQFTDSLIQLVGRFATRQRICYPLLIVTPNSYQFSFEERTVKTRAISTQNNSQGRLPEGFLPSPDIASLCIYPASALRWRQWYVVGEAHSRNFRMYVVILE